MLKDASVLIFFEKVVDHLWNKEVIFFKNFKNDFVFFKK